MCEVGGREAWLACEPANLARLGARFWAASVAGPFER